MASKTTSKSTTKRGDTRSAAQRHAAEHPADLSTNDSPEVHRAAQGFAAQAAVTTALGSTASEKQSQIEQAMTERARIVDEMADEIDRDLQAEAEQQAQERKLVRRPPVVPSRFAGIHPDVTSATSTPPGDVAEHTPGTGVADPRDLAPGQDLSPCPPGGLSIAAQPDKPGTNFSRLRPERVSRP